MSSDLRHELGRRGEQLACDHLERLGYRIVERNHRTRWGEIDVIAWRPGWIVFCEVKTRRGAAVTPLVGIDAAKCRQIRRMAAAWLASGDDRPTASELRFDAIGVTIDGRGALAALEHLEGAF